MNRYTIIVQWSDEDRLFLITVPDFADRVVMPCAYGKTREEAICNGEEVISMYLEGWQAENEYQSLLPKLDSKYYRVGKSGKTMVAK